MSNQLDTLQLEDFDDLLSSVVYETLKRVFTDAGATVIRTYLENECHVKGEEIAAKSEAFSAGLERLLVSAAPVIEKLILKNLCSRLGLKFEMKRGKGFSDYIKELNNTAVTEE